MSDWMHRATVMFVTSLTTKISCIILLLLAAKGNINTLFRYSVVSYITYLLAVNKSSYHSLLKE